ncbi:MAG: cyclophilin family peptidyl-prolyl cis-trans isomerase [Crocinitomix sp.]|jgi:cyclophilin family peptidyl-prolyl cis-trans isomerase
MKKITSLLFVLLAVCSVNAQTNVVFYTSMGNFMIEIREDLVPITGNNFLDLVADEFYDDIIFHRVIDDFMVQSGDPTGTGSGGPGYTIADEFHPDLDNAQMTIAMANSGPDSGGSQFFISLVDNLYLDYDVAPLEYAHAVFGIVTEGFEIVQDIGGVSTNISDRPISNVVIDSIRVTDDFIAAGIVAEDITKNQVNVYPNPIVSNSIISINAANSVTSELSLYDSFGKLISTTNIDLVQGANEFSLAPLTTNVSSSGIYFLRVTMEGSSENVRIIIS